MLVASYDLLYNGIIYTNNSKTDITSKLHPLLNKIIKQIEYSTDFCPNEHKQEDTQHDLKNRDNKSTLDHNIFLAFQSSATN